MESATEVRRPWSKGLIVGQKRPLLPRPVWSIRVRLETSASRSGLASANPWSNRRHSRRVRLWSWRDPVWPCACRGQSRTNPDWQSPRMTALLVLVIGQRLAARIGDPRLRLGRRDAGFARQFLLTVADFQGEALGVGGGRLYLGNRTHRCRQWKRRCRGVAKKQRREEAGSCGGCDGRPDDCGPAQPTPPTSGAVQENAAIAAGHVDAHLRATQKASPARRGPSVVFAENRL